MTMTITSGPRRATVLPSPGSDPERSRHTGRFSPAASRPRLTRRDATALIRTGHAAGKPGRVSHPAAHAGGIGGAVVTAARRSAGLTRRTLARRLGVSPATVRAWETGAVPLYCVGYGQLRQLADVLGQAGARAGTDLDDLLLASQCDLLLAGMLAGFEDYGEVPPLDDGPEGQAARGLLRWALTGDVPEPYRPWTQTGPLLARRDATAFLAAARDLADGTAGLELAGYGTALLALATT
jgi:transcriptional regulator with XRE-family HTH domain